MRSRRGVLFLAMGLAFAFPASAHAAQNGVASTVVPPWLWSVVGVLGMAVAVVLLVDALMLRKVAEGSIVAENIGYMMNSVACFAAAVLAGWIGGAMDDPIVAVQAGFASHLLVIVGMALLAVYFMRIRLSLSLFLKVLTSGSEYPDATDAPADAPAIGDATHEEQDA